VCLRLAQDFKQNFMIVQIVVASHAKQWLR